MSNQSANALRSLCGSLLWEHRNSCAKGVHHFRREIQKVLATGLRTPAYQPPRVLVSACLAGQRVTYRGGSCVQKPLSSIHFIQSLADRVEDAEVAPPLIELFSFCPEVEMLGLSVPRAPIRLWSRGRQLLDATKAEPLMLGRIEAIGNGLARNSHEAPHTIHTELSTSYPISYADRVEVAKSVVNTCAGFIMKSKSPSCGVGDARVYDEPTGGPYTLSDGFFVHDVIKVKKDLRSASVVTERSIRNDHVLLDFLDEVLKV